MRYLRELFIKEGTCGFNDDDEFFHWGGGLLDFVDCFFHCGQDFLMSKDLNRSVISLRELIRLSCWTGFSFGVWSLGGPQNLLCVGGVDLEGRARKFSLVTIGGVTVGLAVEIVDLGAVVLVGALGEGLDLAFLSASSLVLYKGSPCSWRSIARHSLRTSTQIGLFGCGIGGWGQVLEPVRGG